MKSNSNQFVAILVAPILLLIVGCGNALGETDTSAEDRSSPCYESSVSVQNRDQLYEKLERFGAVTLPPQPAESYEPGDILTSIHSSLRTGFNCGLARNSVREAYPDINLKPISDRTLSEILQVTFPSDHKTDFLILQQGFWTRIQKLQKEGFQFSFLKSISDHSIAGVFESSRRKIAFDVLAPPGTLDHEYRHFQQSEQIKKRASEMIQMEEYPLVLNESCISQMNRFIGEVDATTIELPLWKGAFQDFDINPDWSKYPVPELKLQSAAGFAQLKGNLSYPANISHQVTKEACPKEIIDAKETIMSNALVFLNEATEFTKKLFVLRVKNQRYWKEVTKNQCKNVSPAKCEEFKALLEQSEAEKRQALAGFDSAIEKESQARPKWLHEKLNALPYEIKHDLCWEVQGFEWVADCAEIFSGGGSSENQ